VAGFSQSTSVEEFLIDEHYHLVFLCFSGGQPRLPAQNLGMQGVKKWKTTNTHFASVNYGTEPMSYSGSESTTRRGC
jgi:hypothetical protein